MSGARTLAGTAVPGTPRLSRVGLGVPPEQAFEPQAADPIAESAPGALESSFRRDAETHTREARDNRNRAV